MGNKRDQWSYVSFLKKKITSFLFTYFILKIPPGVTFPPSSILTLRLIYPTSSSKESIPLAIILVLRKVTLARDVDDSESATMTIKQLLLLSILTKSWPTGGSWWVIPQVSNYSSSSVSPSPKVLEFSLPKGTHSLRLYFTCHSYVRADHDIGLDAIEVAEGDNSDSDKDMDSDENEW